MEDRAGQCCPINVPGLISASQVSALYCGRSENASPPYDAIEKYFF